MNKNSSKSYYLYFVVIMALLFFTVWIGTWKVRGNNYTRGEFESQMEKDNVVMVTICPNRETPTGSVEITLKSGEEKIL